MDRRQNRWYRGKVGALIIVFAALISIVCTVLAIYNPPKPVPPIVISNPASVKDAPAVDSTDKPAEQTDSENNTGTQSPVYMTNAGLLRELEACLKNTGWGWDKLGNMCYLSYNQHLPEFYTLASVSGVTIKMSISDAGFDKIVHYNFIVNDLPVGNAEAYVAPGKTFNGVKIVYAKINTAGLGFINRKLLIDLQNKYSI